MKTILFAAAAGLLLIVPSTALSCEGSGLDSTRVVSYDLKDETQYATLQIALMFGLTPATFPKEDIEKIKAPCKRGDLAGLPFEVFGNDGDDLERWAVSKTDTRIVYLAMIPPPASIDDWIKKTKGKGSLQIKGQPHFALAVMTSDNVRAVYRIYDGVPPDSTLLTDMKDALEQKPIVVFDVSTGEIKGE